MKAKLVSIPTIALDSLHVPRHVILKKKHIKMLNRLMLNKPFGLGSWNDWRWSIKVHQAMQSSLIKEKKFRCSWGYTHLNVDICQIFLKKKNN